MTAANLPDLDAIQARADAALFHAPYKVVDDTYGKKVVQTSNHPDLRPYVLASKMAPVIADFVAEAPTDIDALIALVRSQQAQIERVEALHNPVTVYELDSVNGTWIYDGDERRVLVTLCGECTPEFVLGEIEDEDYDGGGSDADVHWPCPTIAALTATEGA